MDEGLVTGFVQVQACQLKAMLRFGAAFHAKCYENFRIFLSFHQTAMQTGARILVDGSPRPGNSLRIG